MDEDRITIHPSPVHVIAPCVVQQSPIEEGPRSPTRQQRLIERRRRHLPEEWKSIRQDIDDQDAASLSNVTPPDGGIRAWFVVFCAFLCNGILLGQVNSFGVIFLHLEKRLKSQGIDETSVQSSLVGSITLGVFFLASPLAGVLVDGIGLRMTMLLGSSCATFGMVLSAAFNEYLNVLYLTQGIIFGVGVSLAYLPTISIAGHYFRGHLGFACGVVACGSGLFTILLPLILEKLLLNYGLTNTYFILAGVTSLTILCSFVYKPFVPEIRNRRVILPTSVRPVNMPVKDYIKSFIYMDNWNRQKYITWVICIPLALMGYFVPYVHLAKVVEIKFPGENVHLPLMIIGISSTICRIIGGIVSDIKGFDRIMLQHFALFHMSIVVMIMPLIPSFYILLGIVFMWGCCDGIFLALIAPIAIDICGRKGSAQGIGFVLGASAIPIALGAPIAALLYETFKSYGYAFLFAGLPTLVATSLMCRIYRQFDGFEDNQEHGMDPAFYIDDDAGGNEMRDVRIISEIQHRPVHVDIASSEEEQGGEVVFQNPNTNRVTAEVHVSSSM